MKCPFCNFEDTKVTDSRPIMDGSKIRRRRECLCCKKKFTTLEVVENKVMMVKKLNNTREEYSRKKLVNGISKACVNRPITKEQIEAIVDEIEHTLLGSSRNEFSSTLIGECVMDKLKSIDEVAYVRFASVYKKFENVDTFMDEIKKLKD